VAQHTPLTQNVEPHSSAVEHRSPEASGVRVDVGVPVGVGVGVLVGVLVGGGGSKNKVNSCAGSSLPATSTLQ
jgi:hypothetical protein